jgi:hypothetical protein
VHSDFDVFMTSNFEEAGGCCTKTGGIVYGSATIGQYGEVYFGSGKQLNGSFPVGCAVNRTLTLPPDDGYVYAMNGTSRRL